MIHWAKVVAILEMPNPTDVHILRSFIGLWITIEFMSKTSVLLLILSMHC
jgi:hypothetical protein